MVNKKVLILLAFFKKFLSLQQNQKKEVMTAIQKNAELLRNMSIIAEDENLLKRAAKYMRKLVAEKEDSTLFTKEEYFRMIDEAKQDIAAGKGRSFSNADEMNAWLNSL